MSMSLPTRLSKHLQTMSVWKREIFKWNRADAERDKQLATDRQPLVVLGDVDPNNADLKQLHTASMHGRRKEILEILHKGMWVDFPNDAGQTPLFCSILRGHYGTAELLLQNGANPNEKSDSGMTPVHVACLKANLRSVGALIAAGGDLRLHDNEGNSCLDWARCHPDPRKRLKMMEFLQKSQLFALNYSGDFVGNSLDRQPSVLQMLRGKVSSQMSLDFNQETSLRRVHSHGYGRVYYGGESASGVVSVIPLITENQLQHDADSISFESTSGFVMTGMLWNMTPITVKKQTKKMQKHHTVDLLISEVEHLSKLRHPNVFLLMGLCQSSSFDDVMLAFERVSIGSLHYILHEKIDHLPMTYIRDICSQICQAMVYIHGQNYIHCSLTSHAVFMVSMHQAKVGNLEYMVEMKKASTGRSCLVATSPHKQHIFRWMAPEVMMGNPPSAGGDVYSFCCLLWEMMTSELPWKSKTEQELLELHKSGHARLELPLKSVALFQSIVEEGLQKDPKSRPRDFFTLLRWFQGPLDKAVAWKPSALDRLKFLQKESKERISLGSRFASILEASVSSSFSEQSSSSQLSGNSDDSSSTTALKKETTNVSQLVPIVAARLPLGAQGPDNAKQSTKHNLISDCSDTTNNHSTPERQKSANSSNSCCEDGLDAGDDDGHKITQDSDDSRRRRFIVQSAGLIGTQQLKKDNAERQFDRSRSSSTVQSLPKYSHRTASLPWQGSYGLLRAGSTSPRVCRWSQGHHQHSVSTESSPLERSSKTLPLVKPASHSTDVTDFVRDTAVEFTQGVDVISRRTRRHSPRRSLPSRNRPVGSPGVFPRSRSASGDVLEMSDKEVELSVPGSVRTLTEQFQAQLYHHHLRQSILKGSMTPQGMLFEDLDTSPVCLKQTPNLSEVPPEGSKEKDANSQDRDILTTSSTASTESLTSVSLRDESSADEDEAHVLPVSTRNELDISAKVTMSKPSPVYPSFPADVQYQPAAKRNCKISQERSAFRKISKQMATETDHTDGYSEACGYPQRKSQFLPSSLPGTDVSSHPFDFQDYYIDDDYTGTGHEDHKRLHAQKNRGCEATHITDRSRQRIRKRVWLGDNKTEQKRRNRQHEKKRDGEDWQAVHMQDSAEENREQSHNNQKRVLRKQATEFDEDDACIYRKDQQCTDDHLQSEDGTRKKEVNKYQDHTAAEMTTEEPIYPNRRGERGESKEQHIRPNATFIIEPSVSEEDRDSDKEHFSNWRAVCGAADQKHDEQAEENWQATKTRESRWEEFVRQSQERSMDKSPDSKKDHPETKEEHDRQSNTTHDESQDYEGGAQYKEPVRNENSFDVPDNINALNLGGPNSEDLPTDDEDPFLTTSRGSSLNTVVERPLQALMTQPLGISDDEDENNTTLIPDDVINPPRCIVLNLERNTLSQEELQPHDTTQSLGSRPFATDNDDDDGSTASGPRITFSSSSGAGANRPSHTSTSPQSTLRKFYLGSTAGSQGYSTTLKVESSLQNPGTHYITQTARDTVTGLSQTVHEETVLADTLRTTMSIQ